MNNSYVKRLIESQNIYTMNDERTIITDRMGSWNNQDVTLVWEGDCDGKTISVTPDEVEILFVNGLIRNVTRGENGKLAQEMTYLDNRTFDGAIVCGILAPRTQVSVRQEVIEYAKKMGYISDTMTPVEMFSGTKSLVSNTDGTYSIFFSWHDSIMKKINQELLHKFTKNFFSNQEVEIKSNGVEMTNLSEDKVFSRKNIDIFREYDIQLFYLNSEFDKKLLLQAVMQRAFIDSPCNTLREGQFEKIGNIAIPEDRQEHITFTVPYTECIRELMIDTEKVLKTKYSNNTCTS